MTISAPAPASSATACASCHAVLSEGAHYCHRCGRAVGAGSGERTIWIVAWSTVAIFIALIFYYVSRQSGAAGPDMANAGNASGAPVDRPGAPPDISQMSPRDRFLRLHDRVMSAAEAGDSATVQRFAPMAIAAYGMLDQVDVDLRYHAGALYIQTGALKEALALADTIQAEARDNLFGDMLRLEVARARKDGAGAARVSKAFLEHYDSQLALQRPEYEEHKAMLADLKQQLQRN